MHPCQLGGHDSEAGNVRGDRVLVKSRGLCPARIKGVIGMRHIRATPSAVVMQLIVAMSALQVAYAQASFVGIGDLPGGSYESAINSLSDDGSTVVGFSDDGSAFGGAFRWDAGTGIQPIATAPSSGFDVSPDGSVVVGIYGTPDRAFRWTAGGLLDLGLLPTGTFSAPVALSPDGGTIVGLADRTTIVNIGGFDIEIPENVAVQWIDTIGPAVLGDGDLPGGDPFMIGAEVAFAQARDASTGGAVVVGEAFSASGPEAFRWTSAEGMQGLGDLPGGAFESRAEAITPDGEVIVGSGTSVIGCESFIWTEAAGMVGLGAIPAGLPGAGSGWEALDVTDDGAVLAGRTSCRFFDVNAAAVVWDDVNGLRSVQDILEDDFDLDLTGWHLFGALISADGTVLAGGGINPSGDPEGWVASLPIPLPEADGSMSFMLGAGMLGLLYRRRAVRLARADASVSEKG